MARYSGSHTPSGTRSGERPSVRSCPNDRPDGDDTPSDSDAPDATGVHPGRVSARPEDDEPVGTVRRIDEPWTHRDGKRGAHIAPTPRATGRRGCDEGRGMPEFTSIHGLSRCVKPSEAPHRMAGRPPGSPSDARRHAHAASPVRGRDTNCPPLYSPHFRATLWLPGDRSQGAAKGIRDPHKPLRHLHFHRQQLPSPGPFGSASGKKVSAVADPGEPFVPSGV